MLKHDVSRARGIDEYNVTILRSIPIIGAVRMINAVKMYIIHVGEDTD